MAKPTEGAPPQAPVIETALAEAERKLKVAEAQASLAGLEERQRAAAAPWWRSGKTIAFLSGLLAAVAPLLTWLQTQREVAVQAEREEGRVALQKEVEDGKLALQKSEQAQALRDRYLNTVLTNPKSAEVVLRFVQQTSDDQKMIKWAEREQKHLEESASLADKCFKEAYPKAIQTTTRLASHQDDKAAHELFDKLYSEELLPCETPEMEAAMVRFKQELDKCPTCPGLKNLNYALARQAKVDRYQWETGTRATADKP